VKTRVSKVKPRVNKVKTRVLYAHKYHHPRDGRQQTFKEECKLMDAAKTASTG
jgi:hypothetical protein